MKTIELNAKDFVFSKEGNKRQFILDGKDIKDDLRGFEEAIICITPDGVTMTFEVDADG